MFPLLRGQWTPAVPLAELTSNPQAIEIAGEKLVVFHDDAGNWHAFADRCPHRGAALSLGLVTKDGDLQCRYHGWRFGGDGRCHRVPLNDLRPQAIARISATAVPCLAIAGALWIHTAPMHDGVAPPPPQLPQSLQGPADGFGTYSQHWHAHWTRAVENFIDFAHPSYLHRNTIGAWTHDYAESGGLATVEVEPQAWGFSTLNYFNSRQQGFRVDWYRPNLSILHFGGSVEGKLHVFSIPVSATHTRVMTVRKLPPGADPTAHEARAATVDHTILDEDREVVESQHGAVDEGAEIAVGSDAPAELFRRWHRDMLAGGGVDGGRG